MADSTGTRTPPRKIVRRPDDGPIGGVCAGIAEYLNVDPTIVRIAAVVLAITGPGLPAYILAWVFFPAADGSVLVNGVPKHPGDRRTQVIGIALIAIALSVLWGDWWSPARGWLVPLGLLGGGAWLLLRRDDEDDAPPPPPPPFRPTPPTSPFSVTPVPAPPAGATEPTDTDSNSNSNSDSDTDGATPVTDTTDVTDATTDTEPDETTPGWATGYTTGVLPGAMQWSTPPGDGPPVDPPTDVMDLPEPPEPPAPPQRPRRRRILGPVVLGALLVWGGIVALAGIDIQDGLAVGLCLIGAGFVAGAFIGGSKVLILPALLVGAALVATSIVDIPWEGGVGNKRWDVTSVRDLQDSYELGIGEGTLDLRDLDLSGRAGSTYATDVNVGVGHLLVLVPAGATLKVDGEVDAGDADVLGRHEEGMNVDVHRTIKGDADQGTIALDLHLGLGHIEVRAAA
jgi:phage shock protein PspC (stress-responsive transcriptional regulator)